MRDLLEYVIARHYPDARDAEAPALAVLSAVAERQAALIARLDAGRLHPWRHEY